MRHQRTKTMDQKRKPAHQFELSKLANSSESPIKDKSLSEGFKNGGRVSGSTTEHINTLARAEIPSGNDWTEKLAKLRALKGKIGGKVLGAIPFAGAGYAALQGDPAMAADELAGDVPVLGQAYEALRPEVAGNPEEERMMLAEIQAKKDYQSSPAHQARLRALQGFGR